MTEDELVDDLDRLLRDGLVLVERDVTIDDEAVPRFRPTKKGAAQTAAELLAALKVAEELLARNDIERPEITAALAKAEGR